MRVRAFALRIVVCQLALAVAVASADSVDSPAPASDGDSVLAIAVAPFSTRDPPPPDPVEAEAAEALEGASQRAQVAEDATGAGARAATLLAERLREIAGARVVLPAELGVSPQASPEASDVRSWAERVDVDSVVVGQLALADGAIELLVELRSAHSGAAISRHRESAAEDELAGATNRLARAILGDLGYQPPAELPDVAAAGSQDDSLLERLRTDEPIRISSDELEVITEEALRHLIFSENVRVTRGDATLVTDRLDAYYPDGQSQPERLVASGRVRVVQGERHASCERAEYLRSEDLVVCSGRAILVQGCDRVRGQEIRIDLARERARVVGAASLVIYPEGDEPGACGKKASS